MKLPRSIAPAMLLAAGLLQTPEALAQALEPDQLFEKLSPSIWVVTTFDAAEKRLAQGSGVVIEPGMLITNCHVLARARAVVVRRDNVAYGATLEHADVERDLCQLQVKNFTAPAVELAPTGGLRVGQRVYAVGNPRGLEVTFSDGLISGLRRAADDKTVELVQTTAPISPGSSGGGLFDSTGRLVGITTATRRDSQNLNFAMPADWIREVPARAREALARRQAGDTRTASAGGGSGAPARMGARFVGQSFDYVVVDRLTGRRQNVQLRVERLDGDNVVFGGGRVESLQGKVVRSQGPLLSELDSLNRIGGWVHGDSMGNRSWQIETLADGLTEVRYLLDGVFGGETRIGTPAGEFEVRVFRFSGYRHQMSSQGASNRMVPYEATAWYAPAIHRVVRFVASTRGAFAPVDEEVVLERYDR